MSQHTQEINGPELATQEKPEPEVNGPSSKDQPKKPEPEVNGPRSQDQSKQPEPEANGPGLQDQPEPDPEINGPAGVVLQRIKELQDQQDQDQPPKKSIKKTASGDNTKEGVNSNG